MTSTMQAEETRRGKRIQFEFIPEAYERLNQLKDETGATSLAEVVRNALFVYDLLLKWKSAGYEILVHKDGEPGRVLEVPTLSRAWFRGAATAR